MNTATGLDYLVQNDFAKFKGAKVGIIAHAASVDCKLRHIVDVALAAGVTVVRLFGPEHGIRGGAQDMEQVDHAVDPVTNLPVYSLYGSTEASLYPHRDHLDGLDAVFVDLQDVGARYYTYVQTLAYTMKVAGELGVTVVVIDRPNPIGGTQIEGSRLFDDYRSFCGLFPVANRHGLTIGEFALLMANGFGEGSSHHPAIPCELEVAPLSNWQRSLYFNETGLPWVHPSPNMPTLETAIVYPGACLFEATNISEGRGTTKPFELLGAPFIDGRAWAEATNRLGVPLEGAILRPTQFIPKFSKCADRACEGVHIHVTDRERFNSYRWGLALIYTARQLCPEMFAWRQDAYEFVSDRAAIDLLYGSNEFRKTVETAAGLESIFAELDAFEAWYREARRDLLVYA